MGAVETVAAVATNNRTYYNCPSCGRRVWAYGSYVGNVCWNCPGTIHSAVENTTNKALNPIEPLAKQLAKPNAVYHGTRKVTSTPNNFKDETSALEYNDYIVSYRTRSSRILHGSISWICNAAGKLGIVDEVEHWWTEIKTKNGDYYMLQFCGNFNLIELRKCSTSWECDQCGLREAAKKEDADIWSQYQYEESFKKSNDNKYKYTIGNVVSWLESKDFSPEYHLLKHNCQDLCRSFYRKF